MRQRQHRQISLLKQRKMLANKCIFAYKKVRNFSDFFCVHTHNN